MAKKDLIDTPLAETSATVPGAGAAEPSAAPAPGGAAADLPNPGAGGSYARDPATGELTLTQPATQPPAAMRKTQDPVTGAITRAAL